METGFDRAPLTRARIARAAVALIDEVGEAGFSMRRLAQALGVDPMAVYHHLPNKAAVVHEAIETVVAACPLPEPVGPWPERVRTVCRSFRALAHAHPGVFPMLCVHQAFVPSDFRVLEALLAALSEVGLSPQDTVRAASAFLGYAAGFALDELTGTLRPLSDAERASLRALPVGDFPATARLIDALVDVDVDAEFEFGLDIMLAGTQARKLGGPVADTAGSSGPPRLRVPAGSRRV